jgi:hypothetical protein
MSQSFFESKLRESAEYRQAIDILDQINDLKKQISLLESDLKSISYDVQFLARCEKMKQQMLEMK